jgi:hypothetical protein
MTITALEPREKYPSVAPTIESLQLLGCLPTGTTASFNEIGDKWIVVAL